MIQSRDYVDRSGRVPFRKWRAGLNDRAATKVAIALDRLSQGNTSNVKPVGAGVSELKIDFGPGYRVYFGWDGATLVILLGGGTKARQQRDISEAQNCWADYKSRKQTGV